MSRAWRAGASLVAFLGLAIGANAYAPPLSRIANAVADLNGAAGRGVPLTLEVELQFAGDSEPAATGVLVSSPQGASRLELRSPRGFTERHLTHEGRSQAARDGELLASPRALLPPLYLLQAPNGSQLRSWLRGLGASEVAGLGYQGDHDCYVLGGRDAVVAPDSLPGRTALWVDQDSLAVVRIDLRGSARFHLGPPKSFGAVQLPAWIEIEEAGEPSARLRVLDASPGNLGPGAFAPAWLLAVPPPPPPAPTAPSSAPGPGR